MLSLDGQAYALFDLCQAQGLEGIVLKRKDSRYEVNKRSKSLIKVINYQYTDVWIHGLRKGDFGWVLAFPDGQHAGIMELGVPLENRKQLKAMAADLKCGENEKFISY